MHDELEQSATFPRRVELAAEDLKDIVGWSPWARRRIAVEQQINGIVAEPFDRDFEQPRGLAVEQQLIRIFIGHQRAVIRQAEFDRDGDGCRAQIPIGRTEAGRRCAANILEHVASAQHQVAFGLRVELRIILVHPAVHSDLVSRIDDSAWFVGIDQGADRRHEKARRHVVATEHLQDSRNPDPPSEFAPGEPTDRPPAAAELERLVVAIEGYGKSATRSLGPALRRHRATRTDAADDRAPFLILHLPGLGHDSCSSDHLFAYDTNVRKSMPTMGDGYARVVFFLVTLLSLSMPAYAEDR